MKVMKFGEYKNVNETTYIVGEDGVLRMKEYEMVKDHHPNKFAHLGENFLTSEFAWVIRKNDVIIAVIDGDVDEDNMKLFFSKLQE
jgi:hypothetical protein